MKTFFKLVILPLLFIAAIIVVFSTCKKDTDCYAVITVKKKFDTTVVVSNATVKVHKGDVKTEGVTDASGQFRHTFKLEAILDIDVVAPLPIIDSLLPADTLYGLSVIRLKPGETVYKTVFVDSLY